MATELSVVKPDDSQLAAREVRLLTSVFVVTGQFSYRSWTVGVFQTNQEAAQFAIDAYGEAWRRTEKRKGAMDKSKTQWIKDHPSKLDAAGDLRGLIASSYGVNEIPVLGILATQEVV